MNAPEVEHPERTEHRFARKAVGAVRGHLVTSNQEATDPLVDVVVDRAIRRQAGAVAEVRRPAPQQAVEAIAHLGPATHIAGYEHSADLRLEPQHALLRRTRTQIPVGRPSGNGAGRTRSRESRSARAGRPGSPS